MKAVVTLTISTELGQDCWVWVVCVLLAIVLSAVGIQERTTEKILQWLFFLYFSLSLCLVLAQYLRLFPAWISLRLSAAFLSPSDSSSTFSACSVRFYMCWHVSLKIDDQPFLRIPQFRNVPALPTMTTQWLSTHLLASYSKDLSTAVTNRAWVI